MYVIVNQIKNGTNRHDKCCIHTSFEEHKKKQRNKETKKENNPNKSYIVDGVIQDNEIFTPSVMQYKRI